MKRIYARLWKLAKPYYEKGRPMDGDPERICCMHEAASQKPSRPAAVSGNQ